MAEGGISGWWRAVTAFFSSLFTGDRKKLLENPEVAGELMRQAIERQVKDFGMHRDAVSELMAIVIGDKKQLERLNKEKAELERENAGAVAVAREIAGKMQAAGKSQEDIEANADYAEALQAYKDNSSTLAEKQRRIDDLAARIESNNGKVQNHKIMLQKAQREIEALKVKAAETKAAMYANKALTDVNDRLAQISTRGEDKDLQDVFDTADKLEAKAQISGEMAGNDVTVSREKFKAKAADRSANDAFASLVGVAAAKDKVPAAPAATERAADKLP